MLEALRTIDGGTATIDRIDVAKQPKHIKNIIGIQLQSTMFYDKLTLREQLKMFASLYGQTVDTETVDPRNVARLAEDTRQLTTLQEREASHRYGKWFGERDIYSKACQLR